MHGIETWRCKRQSWVVVPLLAMVWLAASCTEQTHWQYDEPEPDGGHRFVPDGGDTPDGDITPPASDCAALTQGIYVLTRNGHLVRFDPETVSFDQAIPLCPEVGNQAMAVSIDRSARAWVLFENGLLYRVTVDDGVCTVTESELTYPTPDHYYWWGTSMSFVSDAEGSSNETLYYSTSDAAQDGSLGNGECYWREVDSEGWGCAARIGTLEVADGTADLLPESIESVWHLRLTGTGTGELWGLWVDGEPWDENRQEPSSWPVVGQIDKDTGAIISQFELTELEDQTYWWWNDWYNGGGLAFWGGWFYLFMRPADSHSTRIWRFNPETEVLEEVMRESGLDIVGAGVSTCAPVDLY